MAILPPGEICKERMSLLKAWLDLLGMQTKVALQLDDVTEKTDDHIRHRLLLKDGWALHEQTLRALTAYEAHCAAHGCVHAVQGRK